MIYRFLYLLIAFIIMALAFTLVIPMLWWCFTGDDYFKGTQKLIDKIIDDKYQF